MLKISLHSLDLTQPGYQIMAVFVLMSEEQSLQNSSVNISSEINFGY